MRKKNVLLVLRILRFFVADFMKGSADYAD